MSISKLPLRDNNWLLSRLDEIWNKYFADVSQTNKVFIRFGRFARLRLGSIRLDPRTKSSLIVITSMFRDHSIPEVVIDHTIAHELVHYTHGFSSNRPRQKKHPHQGGVIKKEMEERGMGHLHTSYKVWLREYRKFLKHSYGY